jgi:hypothetical protein
VPGSTRQHPGGRVIPPRVQYWREMQMLPCGVNQQRLGHRIAGRTSDRPTSTASSTAPLIMMNCTDYGHYLYVDRLIIPG